MLISHAGLGFIQHGGPVDGKMPIASTGTGFKSSLSASESINVPGLVPLTPLESDSEPNVRVLDFSKQHLTEDDLLQFRTQLRIQNGIAEAGPGGMPSSSYVLTFLELVDVLMQMNKLNSNAMNTLLNFLSAEKLIEKIRYLNLSGNPLGMSRLLFACEITLLDEEAARGIEKFLSQPSCKLQHLDISNCDFDDACMAHICQVATILHFSQC